MAQLAAVFLVVVLGCCCGSPVMQQPLDHSREKDAGIYTSDAAALSSWTGGAAESHTSSRGWQESFSSEERTRHPELNTLDEVSSWADGMDNDLWNAMVSESSSDESDSDESDSDESSSEESSSLCEDETEFESPPPLTGYKFDKEIKNEPRLSLPYADIVDDSSVSTENKSDSGSKEVDLGLKDERFPVRNVSIVGPEVGSKQFEEALGEALKDTLHKMKMVLAAQGSRKRREEEEVDWQQGLSRLRMKRSDEEESSEEASALDELPVNSLNDIVDLFVILARQALEERGLDQVSIPPLERNFSRSLGVGTLRGFFRGDGGWVRRLTTVRRLGDVWLDRGPRPLSGDPRDGRSVSVATSLGLEELMVGFERYVADMRALPTVSGRLVADIDENAVLLNISFSKRDDDPKGCDVNLLHIRVLQLSGINMKLTGLGPLNWLLSRIATWLTTHSQEKVAAVVEKELIGIANKEIGRIPCDADFITALYML